jgi:mono/diheme cytochrome c family protein/glucose/arabinose dehydrogenase
MTMIVPRLLVLISLLVTPAIAQQGDGNKPVNMNPVVPEELIPPSPVLPVAEALKSFRLAPGFVIEPVAAEPWVEKPVCLDFDARGRMWVCEMRGYMPDIDGRGESIPSGRIVILEDTDQDGKVDTRTVFLDHLLLPRALAVFEDGLLFMDETRLCWILRNGDHAVGEPQILDDKLLISGNVEHKPNGLLAGLDNRYYLAKSDRRIRRTDNGWELEPTAFRGQWGIARDDSGRLYHNNNSTLLFGDFLAPNLLQGNPAVKMKFKDFTQLGSNRVWPERVTPAVNRAYISKLNGDQSNTLDPTTYKLINATSAAGMTLYRGTNFPPDWYGTAFTTEPVCNLVKAIRIEFKGGRPTGSHPLGNSEFLASTDERFRPVNAYTAPDGSLYILDMYHGIIQHKTYMTTYLRKQTLSRGLEQPAFGHGRIYRVRSVAGKVEAVRDLAALGGQDLVNQLTHPNAWQRECAQRLLVGRKDLATIPYLAKLADDGSTVARVHAIWSLEGMAELKASHLVASLRSGDASLQASALWATTRLSGAELQKVAPTLLEMTPAANEVNPYWVRALGPLGSDEAFRKIVGILQTAGKSHLVREASVSGLHSHESRFLATVMLGSEDQELVEWLKQAANSGPGAASPAKALTGASLQAFQRGKALFHGEAACFGCHGADGTGMPNLGPPLDDSEWVTGKPENLAKILLHGLTGPLVVKGESYNLAADMPGLAMNPTISDQAIADIATYIRNEWSNQAAPVPATLIKQQRETHQGRAARPWTAVELNP